MNDPACFKSAVEHQLELPKHDPEFTSFSNDGSEWIFRTDYGHVRLTVPEGQCEYYSEDLFFEFLNQDFQQLAPMRPF